MRVGPQWSNRLLLSESRTLDQVRRVATGARGGFRPSYLSSCQLWFDADSIPGADGTAVSSWADRSQHRRHASQPTSSKQPTLKTNIVNGHNVVRFDGTNDGLTIPAPGAIWDDGLSVFAVLQTFSDHNGIYFSLDDDGSNRLAQWKKKGGGNLRILTDIAGSLDGHDSTDQPNNTFLLAEGHLSLFAVWDIDGAQDAKLSVGDVDAARNPQIVIGNQADNTTNPLDGDIASLVVTAPHASPQEEVAVRDYLNSKYALF